MNDKTLDLKRVEAMRDRIVDECIKQNFTSEEFTGLICRCINFTVDNNYFDPKRKERFSPEEYKRLQRKVFGLEREIGELKDWVRQLDEKIFLGGNL